MRENKFRVWDTVKKEWFEENKILIDSKGVVYYRDNDEMLWPYIDTGVLTILHYTGLTDNNGKELYENDLVINSRDMVVYQVVWVEENAKFILALVTKNPNASFELEMCPLTLSLFHCIGNIYEKPEWLEIENG